MPKIQVLEADDDGGFDLDNVIEEEPTPPAPAPTTTSARSGRPAGTPPEETPEPAKRSSPATPVDTLPKHAPPAMKDVGKPLLCKKGISEPESVEVSVPVGSDVTLGDLNVEVKSKGRCIISAPVWSAPLEWTSGTRSSQSKPRHGCTTQQLPFGFR